MKKKNNKKILMYEIFGILIVFCLVIFIYKRNNSEYLNDVKSNMENPITITKTCKGGEYLSGNMCLRCSAGNWCSGNQIHHCPAGKGSLPGQDSYTDCTICSIGYYSTGNGAGCRKCGGGMTSNSDRTGCVPATRKICDAGYFLNGSKCEKCPSGFTSMEGATKKEQCYGTVPAGKFIRCMSTGCETKYCGTNTVNPNMRHVNWSANLGTAEDCVACPKGTKANSNHTECKIDYPDCSDGEYFDGSKCAICPAGNYCNNNSKFSCPAGKESTEGKGASSDCTPCEYRYYSTGDGTGCHKCEPPLETNAERTTCGKKTRTSNCKEGEYLDKSECVKCPTGFNSPAGSVDVNQCYQAVPAGSYLYCVNGTCKPLKCQDNTYSIEKTVTYDNPTTGCTSCPSGTYAKPNHDGCYNYNEKNDGTVCLENTYLAINEETGERVCRKCPNLFTSSKGSDQITDCHITLKAGEYILCNYDKCQVSLCQGNSYSKGGKEYFRYNLTTNCPLCPEGTKPNADHSDCVSDLKCPAGSYFENNECKTCPTHFTSPEGTIGIEMCRISVQPGQKIDCNGTNCVLSYCAIDEYSTYQLLGYRSDLSSPCYKCGEGEKVNSTRSGCVKEDGSSSVFEEIIARIMEAVRQSMQS